MRRIGCTNGNRRERLTDYSQVQVAVLVEATLVCHLQVMADSVFRRKADGEAGLPVRRVGSAELEQRSRLNDPLLPAR